jgi:hypothetical protein
MTLLWNILHLHLHSILLLTSVNLLSCSYSYSLTTFYYWSWSSLYVHTLHPNILIISFTLHSYSCMNHWFLTMNALHLAYYHVSFLLLSLHLWLEALVYLLHHFPSLLLLLSLPTHLLLSYYLILYNSTHCLMLSNSSTVMNLSTMQMRTLHYPITPPNTILLIHLYHWIHLLHLVRSPYMD